MTPLQLVDHTQVAMARNPVHYRCPERVASSEPNPHTETELVPSRFGRKVRYIVEGDHDDGVTGKALGRDGREICTRWTVVLLRELSPA